jgi:hypothetical protein
MTTQAIRNASSAVSAWTEAMQDLFLVSSFALWAVLLGLTPVLAFRLLLGN